MKDGIAEKFDEIIERLTKVKKGMEETTESLKAMLEDNKNTQPVNPAE